MARNYEKDHALIKDDMAVLGSTIYSALRAAYDEGMAAAANMRNVTHGNKLLVEFNDPEFGYLLTCAVRAALLDQTAAYRICHFITPMLPYLDYVTLWTIDQDIKNNAAKIAITDETIKGVWHVFREQVGTMRKRKES